MKCPFTICLALTLSTVLTPAIAQQASLTGVLRDSSGASVPHARLELQREGKSANFVTASNESGTYVFPAVPPGSFTLTASAAGFAVAQFSDLKLEVAAKSTLDITLRLKEVQGSVEVSASGLQINTTDAAVSTVVDRQFVDNIPLNGRSFQSLLTLVPGVSQVVSYAGTNYSGEISVNGQRTESNAFTVDGASVNIGAGHAFASGPGRGAGFAGLTPGVTALGTTQSLVSVDGLDQFRAVTSTYSAEYGRTPGGQFEFSTRSGNNDVHGSLYDSLRNGVLDANNWFNNQAALPRQAERQNDFGGTFGGPVWIPKLYDGREKTFFFFSYEGLRLNQPVGATTVSVPNLTLRTQSPAALQPFLNAFPLPNGADQGNGLALFTGSTSTPSSLNATSVRLDHALGSKLRLFGRYSNSPSSSTLPPNYAQLETIRQNIQTVTFGFTASIKANLVDEFRYNFSSVSARQRRGSAGQYARLLRRTAFSNSHQRYL